MNLIAGLEQFFREQIEIQLTGWRFGKLVFRQLHQAVLIQHVFFPVKNFRGSVSEHKQCFPGGELRLEFRVLPVRPHSERALCLPQGLGFEVAAKNDWRRMAGADAADVAASRIVNNIGGGRKKTGVMHQSVQPTVDCAHKVSGGAQFIAVVIPEHSQLHGVKRRGHAMTDGVRHQYAIAMRAQLFDAVKIATDDIPGLINL